MKRLAGIRQLMLSIGLVLLLALLSGGQALAASLTITLSGSTAEGTRLENIQVLSWSHNVQSPRDSASGLATGRRQYQPLLIRKRIDKASPLLMRAMGRNETFTSLRISIDEAGGGSGAKSTNTMTITLTNAQVVEITHGGDCDDDCDGAAEESVSFIAQRIEWSAGGVAWNDDWLAPAVTTYYMAINEKGVPSRPKKQTKAAAYRTQIISPRDAQSGLPTGKRQHSPFILVMPDSSQTPELTAAFLTGRPIERVSVITYGPDGVAKGAVSLVNVQVASMQETRYFLDPQNRPRQTKLGTVRSNPLYDDLLVASGQECIYELTYQKIEWLDASGGVTHEDTWDTQR